ncbi:peptide chain release factor N(5)-glutamine methyltransferase [Lutibaculum baratangense]|uniref:Release factor glutamine methyltransferase n=1 Tax=Lutibaculum baratangense AMV1 TaxID=631454 RepID=V4RFC9_9HYPH|nr:peptide chain release factor N(5)-glutamine methyltransferase [Lutibaculum baratangense]ESR24079.1 Methylase of polypeptide chain release factor [Lutibaculum baratangense AMV1]
MSGLRASEAARALARRLAERGCDTPDLDARLLTSHAVTGDASRYVLIARDPLDVEARARLEDLAGRRLAGEPVARILGRREFWSLDFELSPDTLDPRPDTETLVAEALCEIDRGPGREAALRLADFGTGSGCILVALLSELPNARGLGIDVSPHALRTARRNAEANGVGERARFVAGDWGAAISARLDVIVTNPPYIESENVPGLAAEVARFDPRRALDGGDDGLEAYRALLPQVPALLAPDGVFMAEIGSSQSAAVSELATAHGLRVDRVARDLAGRDRVVVARRMRR